MLKLASLLVVLFVTMFSTECTTTNKKTLQNLSKEELLKFEEYQAELEIGRNMAGRLLQFYGQYGDDSLTAYVNQVGSYVGRYSNDPERKYMFAILDTDAINAFACPGGYILITLGTIRGAKTEGELAAILGHEIAHVSNKHMFNTLKEMDKKEAQETSKKLSKKGEDPSKFRQRPNGEGETWLGNFLSKYLAGSSSTGLNFLQAAKAGMSLILEKGLDHKLEYEADQEGVKIASNAGYDPFAMLRFLKRLNEEKTKSGASTATLEKTHPKLSERSQKIASLLVSLDSNNSFGAKGENRFLEKIKNIRPVKKEKV